MNPILYLILKLLIVAASLAAFIIIQIKASVVWRLLSIAVLLIICCAISARISRDLAHLAIGEAYARRLYLYDSALDNLALQGRTNDIHQACMRFMKTGLFSMREEDISNFNDLATSTFSLSEKSGMTGTTNKP
jgi:hypothetical protein